MTKVSIIITCHNYGRFLPKAIDSVISQTFDDWQVIVVNDGSTDNSAEVASRYEANEKISVLTLDGIGLAKAANRGIAASSGEYVIRLDADDYFDENILHVLTNILDRHPEYGMVYPDYYRVSKYGEIIDQVRQPKVNDEVKLLDRSALAAGALYRRSCYDTLGGYCEELQYQEDYDFWIRFIENFLVYNVQLPLMYYRQHGASMSTNTEKRMEARRYVKQKFADDSRELKDKKILCVLPIIAENRYQHGLPLVKLGGRPLLSYVIEEAKKVKLFDRIIVDTEDEEIAEVSKTWGADVPFIRHRRLAKLDVQPNEVMRHLLSNLAEQEHYRPDIVLMSHYNYPFARSEHMEEAVNSLAIHHCDSVVGVGANIKFHWQPGPDGLEPVLYPRNLVADQKWVTYEERGGIYAFNPANLQMNSLFGTSVSFIELNETEGMRIDSDLHMWLAEKFLETGYLEKKK
jgi:glycosyltransferase involved in cell wall biosynthesis